MKDLREDLEYQLMNAKINADSPYNDGWTQQYYKDKMDRQVDTQKYTEFVDAVTSNESKGSDAFTVRL